jgi:hypothetical protein
MFEKIERAALRSLPDADWEFAEWKRARLNLDYRIEVDDFLYSVPHALIRAEVDMRVTARMIEIFDRGRRVGAHPRRYGGRKHGADPDHMPSSRQRYAEWTPDRFRRWGGKIGPNTEGPRAWPESLPTGCVRPLLSRAKVVHRSGDRAWRWALRQATAHDLSRQTAHT